MENGAFSAGPADSLTPAESETTPRSQPLEMKTPRGASEEKQPLCRCDTDCACVEAAVQPAGGAPSVRVQSWSRAKTVVMAVVMAALVVWCGVMAVMYHYGVL